MTHANQIALKNTNKRTQRLRFRQKTREGFFLLEIQKRRIQNYGKIYVILI